MRHQPGARVDRFEIIEELGEGAYAETYKALDTDSGRTVVLKSPNPMLFADPAIFGRFKRESEIARSLDHPNVQRSFDLAENRTEPYLVLEFVDGENLRTRVSEIAGPGAGRPGRSTGAASWPRSSPTSTPTASPTATSSPRTSWSPPTTS